MTIDSNDVDIVKPNGGLNGGEKQAVRQKMIELTDAELDAIAGRAAEKAAQRVIADVTSRIYMEVGRTVLSKLTWMIGALIVGAIIWGVSTGWLK